MPDARRLRRDVVIGGVSLLAGVAGDRMFMSPPTSEPVVAVATPVSGNVIDELPPGTAVRLYITERSGEHLRVETYNSQTDTTPWEAWLPIDAVVGGSVSSFDKECARRQFCERNPGRCE